MGAAAASANGCVKPLVHVMRVGQKEGEGARQMCHTMIFSGVKELVKTVPMGKKKQAFYLETAFWKFVK